MLRTMNNNRRSGILLHITSLPSEYGIGDLGTSAHKFVDWLVEAKQTLWQLLPFSIADQHGCPYSSCSAYGGYPLLISLDKLQQLGLLEKKDIPETKPLFGSRVDYPLVEEYKYFLFTKAYETLQKKRKIKKEFEKFCESEAGWLQDLSLFRVISEHFGGKWPDWPIELRDRNNDALLKFNKDNLQRINFHKFLQFIFFKQWGELKSYANSRGVQLIGDIPIFLSLQSMDVWKNPKFFKLAGFEPYVVTGVPPDRFSPTGQKWGNPNYDWQEMEKDGFNWWINRVAYNLKFYDIIRLDHFRGFSATWEIPDGNHDPRSGHWCHVPGHNLFHCLGEKLGYLPIIAEDLGKITPDVIALRKRFGFPGMKILQFAFDEGDYNVNLPHNFDSDNYVVYTGTHDNDTTKGWFEQTQTLEKHYARNYTDAWNDDQMNWSLIDLALKSSAKLAIIPLQDVMGLDNRARLNVPGVTEGNWQWRFSWEELKNQDRNHLKNLTNKHHRN